MLLPLALLASVAAAAPVPPGPDEARRYYYEDIFTPFFAPDPAKPGRLVSARPRATRYSFAKEKPVGTFRVFVVGGSIAQMAADYPRNVGEALAKALPGLKVEMIGCGMMGYDSAREAMVVEELLDDAPDLVVLMTGHNEYLGSPPLPLWQLHAQDRLSRYAAFRALTKALSPVPGAVADTKRFAALARERDAAFASNLGETLRRLRERGVAVAVIAPPLNLRDAPTTTPAPGADAGFLRGRFAAGRGDCAAGAAELRAALAGMTEIADGRSNRSLTRFLLARCLERLGKPEEALVEYRAAVADDLGGARCAPACVETIRASAEKAGAVFADADAALRARAASGIPGLDQFDDNVHWRRAYNGDVSLAVVDALAAAPSLSGLGWDRGALERLRRKWSGAPPALKDSELLSTLEYAYRYLSFDSPQVSWPSVVLLDYVFERRPSWFSDPERLKARLDKAVNSGQVQDWRATLPRLRWHLGEMRLQRGDRAEARRLLAAAVEGDPSLHRARVSLAVAEALDGDADAARATVERAVADSAGDPHLPFRRDEADALLAALGLAPAVVH